MTTRPQKWVSDLGIVDCSDEDILQMEIDANQPIRKFVPPSITRAQCALAMYKMGLITETELVNMTKVGDMPAIVLEAVGNLHDTELQLAKATFARDSYQRDNAMLNALMSAHLTNKEELTDAEIVQRIDDFFILAASD
jgi:hypothetical protein